MKDETADAGAQKDERVQSFLLEWNRLAKREYPNRVRLLNEEDLEFILKNNTLLQKRDSWVRAREQRKIGAISQQSSSNAERHVAKIFSRLLFRSSGRGSILNENAIAIAERRLKNQRVCYPC